MFTDRYTFIYTTSEQTVFCNVDVLPFSLPDSPAEPDNDVEDHGHTEPKLIPHDEVGDYCSSLFPI